CRSRRYATTHANVNGLPLSSFAKSTPAEHPLGANRAELPATRDRRRCWLAKVEAVGTNSIRSYNSLESIAELARVDGAVVLNYNLQVLAFGVKIKEPASSSPCRSPLD
ncbi:MAG: hypothetical protein ACREDR_35200, partial [Blastocatellia bacterium]